MLRNLLTAAVVSLVALSGCNQDQGPVKVENTTTSNNTSTETVTTMGTTTATTTNTSTNTNTQTPVKPKGTLAGQVLKSNLTPLSGATVDLTIGTMLTSNSVTTGMDGNFSFTGIPAGSSVMVTITMMNYGTVRVAGYIPESAGQSPLDDGNLNVGSVVLAELDGRQSFRVVTATGAVATGAKATLSVSPVGYTLISNTFNTAARLVVESTVDANGILTFTGIPKPSTPFLNADYLLTIEPLDTNADGIPDTSGYQNNYSAGTLLTNQALPLAVLPYPQAVSGLGCEASNVQTLQANPSFDPIRNMIKPTDPIRLTFNQPVQPGSIDVKLTDETGRDKITTTIALSATGNTVTITPAANSIRVGQEYNIYVRAVSAQNGTLYASKGWFFGADIAMPQTLAIARAEFIDRATDVNFTRVDGRLDPFETVIITFNGALSRPVGGGGGFVEAFFDADTDGNNSVGGNSTGELGNNSSRGFPIVASEPFGPTYTTTTAPSAQFPMLGSGYTTRFVFTYTGSTPINISSAQVYVKFSFYQFRNPEPYETIWAQPVTADLNSTMTALSQNTVLQ